MTDADWDKRINDAAERAAGIYYEKTKDDIQAVFEYMDLIIAKLDNQPTRDEFNDLVTKVDTIQAAVTDTNRDLHRLEAAFYNA